MPVLFHVREQVICLECRYLDRIKAFAVSIMGKRISNQRSLYFKRRLSITAFKSGLDIKPEATLNSPSRFMKKRVGMLLMPY